MTTEMEWTIRGPRDDSLHLWLPEDTIPISGEDSAHEIRIRHKDGDEIGPDDQELLSTPDFITPTEEEVCIDGEGCKERIITPPTVMSMARTHVRAKRPTSDMRGLLLSRNTNDVTPPLLNGASDHLREDLQVSPNHAESTSFHELFPPNSGAKFSALRLRVQSPVCMTNMFRPNDEIVGPKRQRLKTPDAGGNRVGGLSRYREDFHEIREIGRGSFSKVYKVVNRISGCSYAVKRSIYQLKDSHERERAMTEVHAMARIDAHDNIIRFHSAWIEDEWMYIQMELCECNLSEMKDNGKLSMETALIDVLWQVTQALVAVHGTSIAHLDVKPDNIYYKKGVFKLADFGCATRIDGTLLVEEGDSRYASHEILNEDYNHLDKADIFSLGATMYELSTGGSLPTSGKQFERLRQGKLTLLPGISLPFQLLLKDMMNPEAKLRPTAKELLKHSIFKKIRKKDVMEFIED